MGIRIPAHAQVKGCSERWSLCNRPAFLFTTFSFSFCLVTLTMPLGTAASIGKSAPSGLQHLVEPHRWLNRYSLSAVTLRREDSPDVTRGGQQRRKERQGEPRIAQSTDSSANALNIFTDVQSSATCSNDPLRERGPHSGSLDEFHLRNRVAHAPEHHAAQSGRSGQCPLGDITRLPMSGRGVDTVDDRHHAGPRPYPLQCTR